MRRKRGGARRALSGMLAAVAALAVLLWFFTAVNHLGTSQGEEGRRQLETALRRAAVACYAAEGVYPPDLDYLSERYGVRIEETRYTVFYEIFADNLMPNITVLDKQP